jgi:isoleucyl-tRNA synthetase
VAEHEDLIAQEVRADEIGVVDEGHEEVWDVEGIEVALAIKPLGEAAV